METYFSRSVVSQVLKAPGASLASDLAVHGQAGESVNGGPGDQRLPLAVERPARVVKNPEFMFRVVWLLMEAERPKNGLPFARILTKKETGNRLAAAPVQHLPGPGAHEGSGYRAGREARSSVQRSDPLAEGGRL